ncbi:MAG: pirin family protein [Cyanobacteria bacterium J06623_4]
MPSRPVIAHLIEPEKHDLGSFSVRRSLPHPSRTMVGPFIFFDHLGPAIFPPGKGVDVRPHPHINLATVTYLFEGSLLHRDSLGVVQEILPGEVNWMTAGKGVVHSERSPQAFRESDARLHAIQTWIALPESAEEIAPNFSHHAATDLPIWEEQGGQATTTATLIAGSFGPFTSPVATFSPTLYLSLEFTAGSHFSLPASPLERAIYSVTPDLRVNGEPLEQYRLALLQPDADIDISASNNARCMVVGGEPLGTRHKYWNFVSSRPERIEQAKRDWKEQRFPKVPGETEFIPLPDRVGAG